MQKLILSIFLATAPQDDLKPRWKESYGKAADFLVKNQGKDGFWGREFQGRRFPSMALTVLAVDALARLPQDLLEKHRADVDRGVAAILKGQDEKEGSWSEAQGQLKSYVTAIAIMALHAHDPAKHKDAVQRGQKFLAELQIKEGFWAGSHGYGEVEGKVEGGKFVTKVSEAGNLSTTTVVAEAMHQTGYQDAEYWKRVVEFLKKCQNTTETTVDPEWEKMLAAKGWKRGNDGGFFYKPDTDTAESYGGAKEEQDGKKVFISYGSMTYEGLKTYIWAGLKKDDPAVKATIDWVCKNYSVERHAGFPLEQGVPGNRRKDKQGLYFYYMAMARALAAYDDPPTGIFVTEDGKKRAWAREIAEKLVSLQKKEDGSWVNEHVRWWEGDAMLVTPYVLKLYSVIAKHIEPK